MNNSAESSSMPPAMSGPAILVSHGFQPDYEAGFANGLALNGVRTTLVASDSTLVDRLDHSIEVLNLRGSQDPSRRAWVKAANLLLYWLRLVGLIAWRRPITHLTGLFALSNFSSRWADRSWVMECRLLKMLSKRLVMTVHNVVPHDRDTPWVRHQLMKVYQIPDALVVHTEATRRRLIDEFRVPEGKIHVMDHGLHEIVPADSSRIGQTRDALGYGPTDKVVLFLGWVRRYKGADLLVDAVPMMSSEIKVLIAGNCIDEDYRQEMQAAMLRTGIAGRVTWEFGYLTEQRVSDVLAAADILVMPYREIDQSGVLFAALRHGIPIVAFDVGSIKDYLPQGTGCIVPRGDLPALARALETTEPASRVRDTIHAVANRYRWEETARSIVPLYRTGGDA